MTNTKAADARRNSPRFSARQTVPPARRRHDRETGPNSRVRRRFRPGRAAAAFLNRSDARSATWLSPEPPARLRRWVHRMASRWPSRALPAGLCGRGSRRTAGYPGASAGVWVVRPPAPRDLITQADACRLARVARNCRPSRPRLLQTARRVVTTGAAAAAAAVLMMTPAGAATAHHFSAHYFSAHYFSAHYFSAHSWSHS